MQDTCSDAGILFAIIHGGFMGNLVAILPDTTVIQEAISKTVQHAKLAKNFVVH